MVINALANITNQKSYMTDVGNPCAASTTTLRTYEIIFKTAPTTATMMALTRVVRVPSDMD